MTKHYFRVLLLLLALALHSFFQIVAAQNNPPPITYRLDDRPPEEIFQSGFEAWGTNEDLQEHVFGSSINDRTSAYISTTATLSTFDALVRDWVRPGRTYWQYEIRPTPNFFDVGASLLRSARSTSGAQARRFEMLHSAYAWQMEWAARGSIGSDQIIAARRVELMNGQVTYGGRTINSNYVAVPGQPGNQTIEMGNSANDQVYFIEGSTPLTISSISFLPPGCGGSSARNNVDCRNMRHNFSELENMVRRRVALIKVPLIHDGL